MIKTKVRVSFVFIFFSVVAGGLISMSFYLQVVSKDKLRAYSEKTIREVESYSNRGNILDRNLNLLRLTFQLFNICDAPKYFIEKDLVLLSKIFG